MAKRKRYDRAIRVALECGCTAEINASRYRVSKDLAACIVNSAIRKGIWCFIHQGTCMPVKYLGVFRA
jgi:hypothetical protein